jgi:2,4-dienoyl-CoA reductase (NADPH2)
MKKLFQKARIGKLELKNRLIMPAMGVVYPEEDVVDQSMIDFYVERAKGGIGLVIASCGCVQPVKNKFINLTDDKCIPGLTQLADEVHRHGAKIGLQLLHLGKYAYPVAGVEAVSPSPIMSKFLRQTPRELDISEIGGIVLDFAKAAKRVKESGFDIVELNCATGYLIREFLSPLTNARTDEYGGDLKKRMRFLLEIIQSARDQAGADYPLIVRISGDEFLPGGNTLEEAKFIARELEKTGVDALSVAPGGNETTVPMTIGLVPCGAFAYLAEAIKAEVTIPVVASSRINDPRQAESILNDGKADFVAIGRALLADPEFPNKAAQGKFDEIRKCVACNQGCFDMVWTTLFSGEGAVRCTVNPCVGQEKAFAIKPTDHKKRVMVVGGGPGGMEAARVLALRGHTVSLYEARNKLGGQLRLASISPGKTDFKDSTSYHVNELGRQGVDVFLQQPVTADLVKTQNPDAVIIATGARPIIPQIPGVDGDHVITANEALSEEKATGQKVVVVGGGGIGCETAMFLARKGAADPETALFLSNWGALDRETATALTRRGKQVVLLEKLDSIGNDIGLSRRGFTRKFLGILGVEVITGIEVERITSDGVDIRKGDERQSIAADTVVIAVGSESENELYRALDGQVPELYFIGDSKAPRKAMEAIYEGAKIGREI